MAWVPEKKMPEVTTSTWAPQRLRSLLSEENELSHSAVAAACVITVIASFFLLMLMRPPIVVWKTKENEAPRLHVSALLGWSLVAGVATAVVAHTV